MNFRIGTSGTAHVIVSPRIPERVVVQGAWDDEWIDAVVTIGAGAFRGEFHAHLLPGDFVRFRDQLRPLNESLVGSATFDTLEGWIQIAISADGKGQFHAACVADDEPGVGNRLTFGIDFDQTELPAILGGLDEICDAIAARG